MPIRKKAIKAVKDPIVDLKKKLKRVKLNKRNLLQAYEYEDNSMQCHFHEYNGDKHSSDRNGYLAYNILKSLNTKIRNIYNKLKGTYGITAGTDHPQCSEPPDPIIKCANCNRRPIQNCTSIYQMKLCTFSSALIISKRPFVFIKGYISSDSIDYVICNQCETCE